VYKGANNNTRQGENKMKLSEFLSSGIMCSKVKLLVDVDLNNGESMKAGEYGYILKDYGDGFYHFEYNDFACKVKYDEVDLIGF
jgi:hypothetical protein